MRRLLILILSLAPNLFGQWTDPYGGIELPEPGASSVIVEFRDPPLCLLHDRSAKTAIADYRATFTRFRHDTASIAKQIRFEYFEAFNGVSVTVSDSAIPNLLQLPYVKAVHPNTPVHALATPDANITKIGADRVWSNLGSRGAGIVVAIIDTGVDYNHPALGGGFGRGFRVIGGYDFVNDDADPMDDNFHGTHVAGIVAGNSDDLLGVAPEASLLAYKVLNASGSGSTEQVLAGIERAVDPNGDGDLSDHADVANMSLGGTGDPDDALSMAVDNATAAGVVFCIAAGNAGNFHRIGSPGTARSAITVGATDIGDHIASFSSRGPNIKDAAIKPDVVAPGVDIRSSLPGGKYGLLSGTSMATPHVAGLVALVKSLHRDWTPVQIKSAIVNSGFNISEEIMTQGGGRVDAVRAANATLFIEPSSMSLGEDRLTLQTYSTSATLHLTNRGSQTASYTVFPVAGLGMTINASRPSLSIDAGKSADVTLTFNVTNSVVQPGLSLSLGNAVSIINSTTKDVLRVPWAFMKAARAIVTYDKPGPTAFLVDRSAGRMIPTAPIGATRLEAWLRAGTYDTFLYWFSIDPASLAPDGSFRLSDLRLHYIDGQSVNDDVTLDLNSDQASHTITIDGRNEKGQPLVVSDFSGYASTGRIVMPQTSGIPSIQLSAFATRTWHVSDMSEKLLISELLYSRGDGHFYVLQHSPLAGVHDDATLTAGGSALQGASVTIVSTPAQLGDQRLFLIAQQLAPPRDSSSGWILTKRPASYIATINVFTAANADPDYPYGASIASVTDGATRFTTPLMRVLNDRFVASNTAQTPPWIYDGDAMIFGSGLHYPAQRYSTVSLPLKVNLYTDFVGELGEVRTSERSSTVTTIFNSDASVRGRATAYPMLLDLSQSGAYTIEAVETGVLAQGVPRKSTVTTMIDTNRADYVAPTFTAMMLFDANGRIAPRLEPRSAGSLVFAAADYAYSASGTRSYQPVAADQTKVSYRYSGSQQWRPLTATQVVEDNTSGILFRVDLKETTAIDHALVDMKFELADAAGNTTTFVLEPAFSVGRDSWLGRGPRR